MEIQQQVCRDFMNRNCQRDNCQFLHDPQLCFHYWKFGACKWGDDCRRKHTHTLHQRRPEEKSHHRRGPRQERLERRKHRHAKNTQNFNPSHQAPDMRVLVEAQQQTTQLRVKTRDVILIPDLFPEPDLYDRLVYEVENCGIPEERLLKLWHGDTHYIADDKTGWKEQCPTFQLVIDRIQNYFGMRVQATRFNWFKSTAEWKPFHHDAAAVKPDKARTQNFTVGVSFGFPRDIAFEENDSQKVVSFPLPSGTTYAFARDMNVLWKHGVPQLPPEEHKPEGRISIIAWGWVDQEEA